MERASEEAASNALPERSAEGTSRSSDDVDPKGLALINADRQPPEAVPVRVSTRTAVAYGSAFAVGTAVFFVFGMIARRPVWPNWEMKLDRWLTHHPPWWAHAWVSLFDRVPFIVFTVALTLVACIRRRWALALAGAAGCFLAVLTAEHVFKLLFATGYPSGHVTAATALAMYAWCFMNRRPLGLVVFAVPVVVGWAVVALELHFPADVVGGLMLGSMTVGASVLTVTYATVRLRSRWRAARR